MKTLRNLSLCFLALMMLIPAMAQDKKEKKEKKAYQFEIIKKIPTTSVKNQYRSGTCWSFSGLSLLETELIRMGKGEYDLSEMFIVRKSYEEKAEKYVRMHGKINFAGGGAFYDVLHVIDAYGIYPESVYSGLNYGTEKHVHGELDKLCKGFIDAVIENKNKKLTTAWKTAFSSIMDAYLGAAPEEFEYEGKTYTPKSFAKDLGLNMDDYISLTSYSHHPFYEKFILEIPDNWAWAASYNLPLDELMQVFDNAIDNGYSIAWGADVSEKGFKWSKGIALIPEEERPDLDGLERAKWEELSKKEQLKKLYSFDKILPEKEITQEMRQEAFDNYQTTDDHGMLITGKAKDKKGNIYYIVKNSWDTNNIYDGYFYASDAFVAYKTMNIIVHKDAIPKSIRKKLNIK